MTLNLLTLSNHKTMLGESRGYLTAILHLAPERVSGFNACQYAGACKATCLNTAGRGVYQNVQAARIRKTRWFFSDRPSFMAQLARDVETVCRKAAREKMTPVFRLNGTSDIPWERIPFGSHESIMSAFPELQWYDYTKYPVARRLVLPSNYYLTQSLDVGIGSEREALTALSIGRNVAVAFDAKKGTPLPSSFQLGSQSFPVIDGDVSDLRFLDASPVIVRLRAKGRARRDTSGFVRIAA